MNDLLTLVLLTHNRPAFLERALRYYARFPCRLLVLDSSAVPQQALVESCSQAEYRHFPGDTFTFLDKLKAGVPHIQTPLMAFVPDDDFILGDALQASVEFLTAHPDYSTCHGYCLMYLAEAACTVYLRRDKKVCEDHSASRIAQRLHTGFGEYIPPFYSVVRTQVVQDWYRLVPQDTTLEYQEIGHAFYLLARGKVRILPQPYVIRELNYPVSDHNTDVRLALQDSTPAGLQRRLQFADLFGQLLVALEGGDTSPAQARDVLLGAFQRLADCLQQERSLTAERLFRSQWVAPVDEPQWLFEPRQVLEMPFYRPEFFAFLARLDFMVQGLPAGKLQLQQRAEMHALLTPLLDVLQRDEFAQATVEQHQGDIRKAVAALPFHATLVQCMTLLGSAEERQRWLEWQQAIAGLQGQAPQDIEKGSGLPADATTGRLSIDLDDVLVLNRPIKDGERDPVAVVIHAFYPDVLAGILDRLVRLQQPLHLYVTCPPEAAEAVQLLLAQSGYRHSLLRTENRGRDVLPFLRILQLVRKDGLPIVLKLHTKKSLHLELGSEWADALFDDLLAPARFEKAVTQLENGQGVLMVGPENGLLPVSQFLKGNNLPNLQRLAQRAGLADVQVLNGEFFAGTMFFAHFDVLQPVLDLGLVATDFEAEAGQTEGTLAHALERFFYPLACASGGDRQGQDYRNWLKTRVLADVEYERVSARIQSWAFQPSLLAVIVDEVGDPAYVQQTLDSLAAQLYDCAAILVLSDAEPIGIAAADNLLWQSLGAGWAGQLNSLLPQIEVDWFFVVRSGDHLDRHALLAVGDRIDSHPQALCYYTDEDEISGDLYREPVFKPGFNLDLLRSYPYVGPAFFMQRQALIEIGGFTEAYGALAGVDVMFRLVEQRGLDSVGHIAEVLLHARLHLGRWLSNDRIPELSRQVVGAHLDRLGVSHQFMAGAMPLINRIAYLRETSPLVSIVIPTKNQLPMLRRCVESLLERTQYQNYEILVVDNDSQEADARQWLAGMEEMASSKVRILRYPHPFNYSAINNFAITQASGEYVVLLNNDTAIFDGGWLSALLNHAQRPEVGAVGAKLYYPDGRIQHGGVVLGLRGVADHPFIGEPGQAPGYMHRLQVDQNYSVVTAACLMVRKATYLEVGGMDEQDLKVSFNDVDFCLKLTAAGYLNVWTPYAVVMHEANVSQNLVDTTAMEAKIKRFQGEQAIMYQRWLPRIARDPAYNPNLSLDGSGFALDNRSETGWHPFSVRQLPYALCHPADPYGCGHYRIRKPFEAMQSGGLLEGGVSERLLTAVEKERLAPTTIVFQRQIMGLQIESIREAKRYSQAFRIYELDDYIVDLPIKNRHRAHMPMDVAKQLRRGVAMCDRFVVSTAPLAEAFKDLHPDIRIAENLLPLDWWQSVKGQRRDTRKPRVGWGGGVSHDGDLELIRDVVKDLAGEVDWVFFGMCPEELRPYIKEFHAGVPIDRYAAKLASLDLDLALAPLEENLFNDCKSNLRLLEYGACGFAVVCSDLVCYRGDLPVTRVKNRYRDWVDAIRMHLADRDATHRAGEVLRGAVQRDWMLTGPRLERWGSVWLPD